MRDEADVPYDGQTKADRNGGRFSMTPDCVWALHEPYPILVYGALALYADREGVCWPSMATIAEQTGISERSVLRAIERLEETGIIVRERTTVHGMKSANRYRLVPHRSPLNQYRQTVSTSRPIVSHVLPESQSGTAPQSDKPNSGELEPSEEDARELVRSFVLAALGKYPRSVGKKDIETAKDLLSLGANPGEMREIVAWMRRDGFWKDGFGFGHLRSQYVKWRNSKGTTGANGAPSLRPTDYGYYGSTGLQEFREAVRRGEIPGVTPTMVEARA